MNQCQQLAEIHAYASFRLKCWIPSVHLIELPILTRTPTHLPQPYTLTSFESYFHSLYIPRESAPE